MSQTPSPTVPPMGTPTPTTVPPMRIPSPTTAVQIILMGTLTNRWRMATQLSIWGANVKVKDEDGAIPLHDACAGGYTEIVQLLLNHASGLESVERMLESKTSTG
ncbi:hypothetical protein LINPERPRIM_LOCUS6817 [Linum perenne]